MLIFKASRGKFLDLPVDSVSQSLCRDLPDSEYVVNSTNYKNSTLVSLYNEYVHQCKINYPPKSKLERIDTLKLSQVELNHANFCFVQARGYSYKPNKSLMFGFLLSPVCVHWQCIGSQTCINRTCLSMCLCVYINAYQIRHSTKPLDWACIMQQVNLAKASI